MGKKHNGSLSTVKPVIQELGTLLTRAFKAGNRNTILSRASTILGEEFSSPTSLSKAIKDLDPEEARKIKPLKKALTAFAFTGNAQDPAPSICPTQEEMLQVQKSDIDALLQHLRLEQIPDMELLGDDDESPENGTLFSKPDFQY